MVNCKNCGAPLSLEEAVCPHCGTPNPEAIEHLKKLQELNESFKQTKFEVADEVKKSKKGYGVLIILAIVLLANLALIPFHSASDEIAEKVIASKMSKAQITEKLDSLLQQGEYADFYIFANKFSLSYRDYAKYNEVSYLAEMYSRLIDTVTDYYYGKDLYMDPLVRASQVIRDFKEECARYAKRDSYPEMKVYINDIEKQFDLYAKTYLKLTDEDLNGAAQMSESDILIRINERLNDEE